MKLKVDGNTMHGLGKDFHAEPRKCRTNVPGLLFHAGPYTAFQVAPRKQLVHVKNLGGNEVETYEIQLPWIVYVASVFDGVLSNVFLYASPDRITSLSQRLYRLPLSNLYRDSRFCMPKKIVAAPDTIDKLFEEIISIVWDSYYNADLFDEIEDHIWDFPFMEYYPKDLPDHSIYQGVFAKMLTPGDVLQLWEENITEDNLSELFNEHLICDPSVLSDELPRFASRNVVLANCLQYMG